MIHRIARNVRRWLKIARANDGGAAMNERDFLPNRAREVERHLVANRPADALSLAMKCAVEEANNRGVQYMLGICLDRVGRHEEALTAYERELSNHPDHLKARERFDALSHTLTKPSVETRPFQPRLWPTSLPHEVLLPIQRAVHRYTYRGVPLQKNPFDLALYPLLLWTLKPRTIFEIGSKSGGSSLWFGDLLETFGIDGHVYSLDIVPVEAVCHPRVTFLKGDGRDLGQTLHDEFLESLPRPWLVTEDADHAYETSIAVLRFFDRWLRPGELIVVEDGIISDLRRDADCNSGPHLALKKFLGEHVETYEIATEYCDFFGHNVTWCTNGFLRRR